MGRVTVQASIAAWVKIGGEAVGVAVWIACVKGVADESGEAASVGVGEGDETGAGKVLEAAEVTVTSISLEFLSLKQLVVKIISKSDANKQISRFNITLFLEQVSSSRIKYWEIVDNSYPDIQPKNSWPGKLQKNKLDHHDRNIHNIDTSEVAFAHPGSMSNTKHIYQVRYNYKSLAHCINCNIHMYRHKQYQVSPLVP